MYQKLAAISALVAAAQAQQACTLTAETHPSLSWQTCTSSGCTTVEGSVVLDANWRWTHIVDGSTNCYTGNEWDTTICTDGETCAQGCCVDGVDYEATYGITTNGDSLSLTFVTEHQYGTNIGSRVYLMESEDSYQMFNLLGNEFTFDVDVSNLPCGLNGALYHVSMDQDGGLSEYDGNSAGAKFGTGYCDSQCPRDVKFIGGVANVEGWESSSNDENAGVGNLGACCAEMDIWEANSISNAYTPHPCEDSSYHVCEGDNCGGTYSDQRYAGDCDPDGCDFNPYRQGNATFYGPGSGFVIDTTQVMTVVTQFIEEGGALSEIKRFYVQNGNVVANAQSALGPSGNSLTQEWCEAQKEAFGDEDVFTSHGGMAQMGGALSSMVLVMSLWDDHYANMLWLDSTYPVDDTSLGAERGTCSTDSGVPADVEANYPDASVVFSNIKFGPIGSTFDSSGVDDGGSGGSTTTAGSGGSTTTTAACTASSTVAVYGQCGGASYTGSTICATGSCCTYSNDWYSQCIPGDCTAEDSCDDSGATTTTTTTTTTGSGGGSTPTAVTTTLPASAGSTSASTAIPVSGSFDGGMMKYDRSPAVCQEQTETGEADAMFILEDGATLSNVIIGPNQAEGVHCKGTCTLINVWWQDVCEDAATFKQSSGTSYVIGGGAFAAADKILQFNGFGTLSVSNFYAEDYGKLVRSCGNCSNNGNARHIIIDGVVAVNGGVLCGVNTNYGDTCIITDSCQDEGKSCALYTGNNNGGEPDNYANGPDGEYCIVTNLTEDC